MPVSKFSILEMVKVLGLPINVTYTESETPQGTKLASRAQPSKDRGHPTAQPQSLKDRTQSSDS